MRLTTGGYLGLHPAVPELVSTICLMVLAFSARAATRDAFDVWFVLCLQVVPERRVGPPHTPADRLPRGACVPS